MNKHLIINRMTMALSLLARREDDTILPGEEEDSLRLTSATLVEMLHEIDCDLLRAA